MASKGSKKESLIYYADAAVEAPEPDKSLPPKFRRMLARLDLGSKVKGKSVGIKMHFGGGTGYTTIHPVFIRILVDALRNAGAQSIKCMDGNNPNEGLARGYTREILGCETVSCFGASGKYTRPKRIGFKGLDEALFGGEALDCDFYLNLSHVKGHGDCGFGGALKNIAMGVVPPKTRGKIHGLEGGITFDQDKCKFCLKCVGSCRNNAIETNKEKKSISFFFHNCTYCQHCVMICPTGAVKMEKRRFEDFSKGMALVAASFLSEFDPKNLLFINFLTNITIFCDCWGMSTPSLVPDIGILASDDIVAIERATLDMIKTENFLPSGLPKNRELGKGKHLFEKIHAKDPYLSLEYLEKEYGGNRRYRLEEVK